jgi:pimeloyl-ACP methyl ester carboxylesterase
MGRKTLELPHPTGTIHAVYAPAVQISGPLVVAIPGGTYTWEFFDAGEHSLFAVAELNGLSVLALDRPNYGASSALALESGRSFAANAEAIDEALAHFWAEYGDGYEGIVLVGHSIGGMISLHIAARTLDWPLLGICSDGFGSQIVPRPPLDVTDGRVVFTPEIRRLAMFAADGTFDPELAAAVPTEGAPLAEIDDAFGAWGQVQLPAVGPQVKVPVCLSSAEHDGLWIINDATIAALHDAFTSSPWVDTPLIVGTGHCIDHHHAAHSFNLRRVGFAYACAALARDTRATTGAGA